jgi:hypothetical protein
MMREHMCMCCDRGAQSGRNGAADPFHPHTAFNPFLSLCLGDAVLANGCYET